MFTGIVAGMGRVDSFATTPVGAALSVASGLLSSVNTGDSVAVNGVCLTVVKKGGNFAAFDVIRQTLGSTNLKSVKIGDPVNLELPLKAGDNISGHFVTGHIDCVGKIKDIAKRVAAISLEVEVGAGYRALLVDKGSVALDGISLTVAGIKDSAFRVNIIPHTFDGTTLGSRRSGDGVNVEFDILGKYLLRPRAAKGAGVTEEFLKEKGFI